MNSEPAEQTNVSARQAYWQELMIVDSMSADFSTSSRQSDGNFMGQMEAMAEHVKLLEAFLSQAEGNLNACRIAVNLIQSGAIAEYGADARPARYQSSLVTDGLASKNAMRQEEQAHKKYRRRNYGSVNVDVVQLFRKYISEVGIGPIILFMKMLEQCGSIVESAELLAALDTNSKNVIKIYISKLRSVLRKKNVIVDIVCVNGGYGLHADSIVNIIKGLNFTEEEVQLTMQILPKGRKKGNVVKLT